MKKIAGLLLLGLYVGMAARGQYPLKGRVTDPEGGPLPGAHVMLEGTYQGVTTGDGGYFELRNLKPGNYVLAVTFIGFEDYRQEVSATEGREIRVVMKPEVLLTGEVMVQATRARGKTPVAYTNLSAEELQSRNMGQDLPYLLAQTPSWVSTSDAGTGIGYTSFRVRGTDMNRINITVNGIPLNDAESHSTFFVDQPDLVSSADVIQVQRGAGTSTNGAAAFGASINLQTLDLKTKPYAEYHGAAGSFKSLKNTFAAGTGLINGHFSADARLSAITSDGFIDRAFSDLRSWYLSAGYYSASSVIKAVAFAGQEETFQAWNGVPSVRLNNDTAGMRRYFDHGLYTAAETSHMLASDSRTFNLYTYPDQVDNYRQQNYQLHFTHRFSRFLTLHAALHHTTGKGYFEQFRENQKFSSYNLPNPVVGDVEVRRTDLVRRKWLDNDFSGLLFSLNRTGEKSTLSWGGGWNHYDGHHFGRIVWGRHLGDLPPGHEWYRNRGRKSDLNLYAKGNYQLLPSLSLYGDLQYRQIRYRLRGLDDDLRDLGQAHRFGFFNPKAGLFWQAGPSHTAYLSYALTHREPNRDNFTDNPPGSPPPGAETLHDLEAGWTFRSAAFTAGANLYGMFYHDQLVLTGRINDVGAAIMTNVPVSHRAGIELTWGWKPVAHFRWEGNATLSRNRIRGFTEYVDDWDNGGQQAFGPYNTRLSFSPAFLANSRLVWQPGKLTLSMMTAYTGKQYLDNSASEERMLEDWCVSHLKSEYRIPFGKGGTLMIHLQVNNLFDAAYESNGWVYSYILGGERYRMDGYFPQAGRHFMAGLSVIL